MTGNRYPNGILFIPTEFTLSDPAGDLRFGQEGPHVPAVVRLPAALIPKQPLSSAVLAGEACVRCGGYLGPMIPCGTGPGGAIFVHDPLCEDSSSSSDNQQEGVIRYRVVFEVGVPNRIPSEEHVALAIGITAAADFLPDRVYRLDGSEWVQVYDEAGP